ncbi:MAG: hypothetical protein ABIH08_02360 [Candidatus Omnitrophota bacterium]
MNNKKKIPDKMEQVLTYEFQAFWDFVNIGASKSKVSLRDWEFIAESGTFSRMIRRWYQTTWLKDNYCDLFNGTTPCQYVNNVSNNILDVKNLYWYVPCSINEYSLFEKKELVMNSYRIAYSPRNYREAECFLPFMLDFGILRKLYNKGVSATSKKKLSGTYKNHWRDFISQDKNYMYWITEILYMNRLLDFEITAKNGTGKFFLNSRGKAYFSLDPKDQVPSFIQYAIENASKKIVDALEPHIVCGKERELENDKKQLLFAELNKKLNLVLNADEWVEVDAMIFSFWDVLFEMFGNMLFDSQTVKKMSDPKVKKYWEDKEPLKAISVKYAFMALGMALDKYFLFPFNWYLGAIECVWLYYEQMIEDLYYYFDFAKKLSSVSWFYSEDRERLENFENIFLSPCSFFRPVQLK